MRPSKQLIAWLSKNGSVLVALEDVAHGRANFIFNITYKKPKVTQSPSAKKQAARIARASRPRAKAPS